MDTSFKEIVNNAPTKLEAIKMKKIYRITKIISIGWIELFLICQRKKKTSEFILSES